MKVIWRTDELTDAFIQYQRISQISGPEVSKEQFEHAISKKLAFGPV
jgi:hypothetical protein